MFNPLNTPTTMNVIFTNVGNSGENGMVFVEDPEITPDMLASFYRYRGITFTEHYEVPESSLEFYSYEPVWMSPEGAKVVKSFCKQVAL